LKKKRGAQFPLTQFIAIVVISISVFLAVDFARRMATIYRIKNEAVRLEEEVVTARANSEALEARLRYVQSDAYVEEIARTQLKWALPGETVVVVMATPQAVVAPPSDNLYTSPAMPPPETPWQAWWYLFFDASPPE
jgi:cell division protein FtsB